MTDNDAVILASIRDLRNSITKLSHHLTANTLQLAQLTDAICKSNDSKRLAKTKFAILEEVRDQHRKTREHNTKLFSA